MVNQLIQGGDRECAAAKDSFERAQRLKQDPKTITEKQKDHVGPPDTFTRTHPVSSKEILTKPRRYITDTGAIKG